MGLVHCCQQHILFGKTVHILSCALCVGTPLNRIQMIPWVVAVSHLGVSQHACGQPQKPVNACQCVWKGTQGRS